MSDFCPAPHNRNSGLYRLLAAGGHRFARHLLFCNHFRVKSGLAGVSKCKHTAFLCSREPCPIHITLTPTYQGSIMLEATKVNDKPITYVSLSIKTIA